MAYLNHLYISRAWSNRNLVKFKKNFLELENMRPDQDLDAAKLLGEEPSIVVAS